MTARVIWCLGMYASASTWLFNVVRRIHAVAEPTRLQTHFVGARSNFEKFDQPHAIRLVKSHEVSDEATLIELAGRASKIFITVRDPRDSVTSLMLYHNHDFDRALNLVEEASRLCAGFAKDKRAKFFRYEERFFENPDTVQRVAADLGYQLPDDVAQEIFNGMSWTAVEKHIAGLPKQPDVLQDRISGDLLDPLTQWHTHHAGRSGETGRWQHMLSEAQASEVSKRLREALPHLSR